MKLFGYSAVPYTRYNWYDSVGSLSSQESWKQICCGCSWCYACGPISCDSTHPNHVEISQEAFISISRQVRDIALFFVGMRKGDRISYKKERNAIDLIIIDLLNLLHI